MGSLSGEVTLPFSFSHTFPEEKNFLRRIFNLGANAFLQKLSPFFERLRRAGKHTRNKKSCFPVQKLGLVIQSIVSFTSSLRSQLVECFMTLQHSSLIFLSKTKMREVQKLLTFFSTKILAYMYMRY